MSNGWRMDSKLQMSGSDDKKPGIVYKYSFEGNQQIYVVLSEHFSTGRFQVCIVMWDDGSIDSLAASVIGNSHDVKL